MLRRVMRVMRVCVFAGSLLITSQPASAGCEVFAAGWQRASQPFFRDPIPNVGYEVAGDPHLISDETGLALFYTGDDGDLASIKLARGAELSGLDAGRVVLGPSRGHLRPRYKETPFYRRGASGEHQIYFVGYQDEEVYGAAIWLAIAGQIDGPYRIMPEPVVRPGRHAGRDVALFTSPSVVMHDGRLHLAVLGWDAFPEVRRVWVLGATSLDGGRSWSALREIEAPIAMEGQITPRPDGGFVAVRTGGDVGREAVFAACASHPFGPYEEHVSPLLRQAGPPWEVDEIIAAQITYGADGSPLLLYTGADHRRGWWILSAGPGPR